MEEKESILKRLEIYTNEYFVKGLFEKEKELWGLNNKENMSADKEPTNLWDKEYNKIEEEEEWEKKRREELDKELEHGSYEIGIKPDVFYTGKGGYINYIILLEKEVRKSKPYNMREEQLNKEELDKLINEEEVKRTQRTFTDSSKIRRAKKKERFKPTNLTPPKKKRKK